MQWVNNPWIVGIGTSILSGLIVFFITRYILSSRKDKEYKQKVSSVNREVASAIKPGISEKEIPSNEVISALIDSTARKYGVDTDDVHSPNQIADELIKEVMDSSFISASDKEEFCDMISEVKVVGGDTVVSDESEKQVSDKDTDVNDRLIRDFSLIMAFMTTVFVMLTSYLSSGNILAEEMRKIGDNIHYEVVLMGMMSIIIAMTLAVSLSHYYSTQFGKDDEDSEPSLEGQEKGGSNENIDEDGLSVDNEEEIKETA